MIDLVARQVQLLRAIIEEFIENYPYRSAGSKSELAAQKKFARLLKQLGLRSRFEVFKAPINSWFGSLKILGLAQLTSPKQPL